MTVAAIVSLLSTAIILLAGFRVYLMERNNISYQAFGIICGNLAWMSFCWYEMEQTSDLKTAQFYRELQFVWALNNPIMVFCSWRFAEMHLKNVRRWIRYSFFTLIIAPGVFFAWLELFTANGHGHVVLLANGRWGLQIQGDIYTYLRGIWTILIMGSCLFFIHKVYKAEPMAYKKRWLAILMLFFGFIILSTFSTNYILPLQGKIQPLNESLSFAVAIVVMGWGISDFRLFELKPESAFEQVTQSMTNLLILVDQALHIKMVNASALAFFDKNEREVRNQPLATLIGTAAVNGLFNELFLSNRHAEQEIAFARGDQKTSFLVTISIIYNHRGKVRGYALVGTDLTPHHVALEKIQHYNARLEASNKALERFAYSASHDLKEPLRTISGFVNLLNQETRHFSNPNTLEYLRYIDQGIKRMDAIIKSLLELSRLNDEKMIRQYVDLNLILVEIREKLFSLITRKNARIIGKDLPWIYTHYGQMNLLFQNLIENGIKYNKNPQPIVEVSCQQSGDGYEFAVRDNGIGIEPKYREQIFLMFKRLHSWGEFEGTGMGLAICKKIVESLDGKIWVEPNDGAGSVFKFWIPFSAGADHPDEIAGAVLSGNS